MKDKHIPLRMCVACRVMKPQNELIRFVCSGGITELDLEKKKFGRGAYICRSAECVAKAAKKNVLARHFRCSVPKDIYLEVSEIITPE
jgi:hypothetical protein